MAATDRISPEIRSAERQIDEFYRTNPLFQRPFAEAAWYFLAHCEEVQFREHIRGSDFDLQRQACVIDEIVNNMKWPLRWIRRACRAGGRIPASLPAEPYNNAWHLFDLAAEYADFENAFTYAFLGCIELALDGDKLVPTSSLRADTRYEAYDRLVKPVHAKIGSDAVAFLSQIDRTIQVSRDKFAYHLNPKIVGQGMEIVATIYPSSILLPSDWCFPRYSIAEVDRVALALRTLAFIHFRARIRAAELGCIGCGYSNAILVMGTEELQSRVVRYTGVRESRVADVLTDLTFGARGQENADPALQPLISLTETRIAIPPILVLGSDFRRNFAVLLNRMPAEKAVYSRLNQQREELCRDNARATFAEAGFRTWNGPWPGRSDLPDIDLVVICDREKHCLFLELKAFIEPAEAREIVQRDEEIAKGIRQGNRLRTAYWHDSTTIRGVLGTDDQYAATFVVASESGIGSCVIQEPSIPVIRVAHLLSAIQAKGSLKELCEWLRRREFLPLKGIHYEEVTVIKRVGRWELDWYGIKPLIASNFE